MGATGTRCRWIAAPALALMMSVSSSGAPVTVSGTIRYTGRTGAEGDAGSDALFAVRGARIELWDENTTGPFHSMKAAVYTDNDGFYSATFDDIDGDIGPGVGTADIFLRIIAQSQLALPALLGIQSAYQVVHPGPVVLGNETADTVYFTQTSSVMNVLGAQTIDHDFAAGLDSSPYSVFDILTTASRYHTSLPGTINNEITATFATADSTSNFSGGLLHVLEGDRFDWDVVGHEYGHFVQSLYGIENTPGGGHSSSNNLRISRAAGGDDLPGNVLNRRQANRLAWGEGLATYLGLVAALEQPAPADIQRAGDTLYNDNDDADGTTQGLRYGIESQTVGTRPSRGEDNEATVSRILLDLYDAANDAVDRDRVTLGHAKVFEIMDAANATTLHEFWSALVTQGGITNKDRIDYGAIFQAHNVSPQPDATSVTDGTSFARGGGDPAPTFTWARPQGGQLSTGYTTDLLHDFGLKIFDSTYAEIFDSGFLGDLTSFTPNPGQWTTITDLEGLYRWIIYGREVTTESLVPEGGAGTFVYTTGSYWSDSLSFNVVPEPTSLCVLLLAGLASAASRRRSH